VKVDSKHVAAAQRVDAMAAAGAAAAAKVLETLREDEKRSHVQSVQCANTTSAEYKLQMQDGWSPWQPYVALGDVRKPTQKACSLIGVKELKRLGFERQPDEFGVYNVGVLAPDAKDNTELMTVVNYGVTGIQPNEANTIRGRLRSYPTKVQPHEWFIAPCMKLGFTVWSRHKVVVAPDETKGRTSIEGAKLRRDMEKKAHATWNFFLDTADQANGKGKGASLHRDPFTLMVKAPGDGTEPWKIKRLRSYRAECDKDVLAAQLQMLLHHYGSKEQAMQYVQTMLNAM
jgi:hypothetical protein